jgi:hypothetical protein
MIRQQACPTLYEEEKNFSAVDTRKGLGKKIFDRE